MRGMDALDLERALAAAEARPILLDARVLRRVIKRHRHLPGFGLQVPHARCYAISRDELLALATPGELGRPASDLPPEVILLPRPDADDLARTPLAEMLARLHRYAFHARVHQAIERAARDGRLTEARLKERVHRIGQTEFDEIRLVLRQDDMLLPPHGDLDTYAEFAALYLELSRFAPPLVREIFPTLGDARAVEGALAEDVDVAQLLAATRPLGAPDPAEAAAYSAAPPPPPEDEVPAPAGPPRASRIAAADDARARGNVVRSAISRLALGDAEEARADLAKLAERLDAAVGGGVDRAGWEASLFALCRAAARRSGVLRWVESRVLFDLQRAAIASDRAIGKVDLIDWALSLGRRPVVRLLPATRPIRVARQLASAAKKIPRVSLPEPSRARLAALLADARRRADAHTRELLRPAVRAALAEVGLRPADLPERVALHKLVEELLDQATARGFLNLSLLRDAVSRNQLKLGDVKGPGELILGDPLLLADHRLAQDLDGVHRRGEVYLRWLQKLSSLFFGTRLGRVVTQYVLMPFGGAAVLIKGAAVMVTEVGHLLHRIPHHHHVEWLSPARVIGLGLVFFALLHSQTAFEAARAAVRLLFRGLTAVLVDAPRWVLRRPLVRAILASRAVALVRRFLLKPALLAAAIVYATPLRRAPSAPQLAVAAGAFVLLNLALNSRAGALAEEIALDALARTSRRLRRHILPGLFRLVADFFRRLTDGVERGIYAVDEWLRFHEGQSKPALFVKAVLSTIWFAVAYVVRIWINLIMEPTVNPIKHFPWVTVAAKLLLPVTKPLGAAVYNTLARYIGGFVAAPITAVTVPFVSGLFGFLAWELKENYKLYGQTRAATLRPVAIGHHGETMAALLKPGLHSGTIPKAWAKHRRAARKGDGSIEKHGEVLREIGEAVERFVERDLCATLEESPLWEGGHLRVTKVALASNRVRVEIAAGHGEGGEPAVISFEEQSGLVAAGMPEAGFVAHLGERDRVLFENALGGLYHLAAVDLVREQVEAQLPEGEAYDIADEGLVVWPGGGWETELVYDLEARGTLTPRVRGEGAASPPPALDRARLLFREQPLTYAAWVAAWSAEEPPRLFAEGPLLPGPHRR